MWRRRAGNSGGGGASVTLRLFFGLKTENELCIALDQGVNCIESQV